MLFLLKPINLGKKAESIKLRKLRERRMDMKQQMLKFNVGSIDALLSVKEQIINPDLTNQIMSEELLDQRENKKNQLIELVRMLEEVFCESS